MNCLKCGRTVAENTLLCTECLRAREAPARREPERSPEQSREKRLAAALRSQRRLRRWLALFVAAAILATVALGGAGVYALRLRRQRASQTSRINSLETVISEKDSLLDQANALNNTLRDSIEQDREIIDAYERLTGLTPEEVVAPPAAQPAETP